MKRTTLGLVTAVLALPLLGVAGAGSASAGPAGDGFQSRYTACLDRLGDAPRSADVLQGWITGCRAEAKR
jgi:hypothetical protein